MKLQFFGKNLNLFFPITIIIIFLVVFVWLFAFFGQGDNVYVTLSDYFYVSLKVSVAPLLNNMQALDEAQHTLVPYNGILFPKTYVRAIEGDSVFDILLREMTAANIHLAFRNMPFYNSAYINGIGNIFEFDAGPLSGWMYTVNNYFPGIGVSQKIVSPSYDILLIYSLEMGNDL